MKRLKMIRLIRQGWDGRDWYDKVRCGVMNICLDSSDLHSGISDLKFRRFIEVMAILSPRTSTTRCIRNTCQYIQTSTLPSDVTRFTRAALLHYENTGIIRGQKTKAFAECLKSPYSQHVCLDVWMARAADIPQKKLSTKRVYQSYSRRIRWAAKILNITPMQAQAAIWCAALKNSGRNPPVPDISKEWNLVRSRIASAT